MGGTRERLITAVDPSPEPELLDLAKEHGRLRLEEATSFEAIPRMDPPDAFIIDGDHNYYTVSEELKLIEQRSATSAMPLPLFHDVCWPHARRDSYYAPERIPDEYRSTIAEGVGIAPGSPGITHGGLPSMHVQEREGGERNGVLTAIEDFLAGRPDLEFAILPMFFGLGVCWPRDVRYAESLRSLTAPLDRNPLLARLEWNRVSRWPTATWRGPKATTLAPTSPSSESSTASRRSAAGGRRPCFARSRHRTGFASSSG